MAENRRSSTHAESSPDLPLLRQGRPADPAPANVMNPVNADSSPALSAEKTTEPNGTPDQKAAPTGVITEETETSVGQGFQTGIEKTSAESRQRTLRLMLRQCDRVMLMDFGLLAMSDWPDNYTLAVARRNRDLWLFFTLVAALVFLSGMTGFVPAWIAGSGFGAFVILLMAGLPAVRGLVTRKPSYLDLIIRRRRLLQDARKHIQHLEGTDGLVWQCAQMAEFNPHLRAARFSELRALSERRMLARHMNRREHVRLYLIYMLEAEKAYSRAEKAFFEGHQSALDKGWESVAVPSEDQA